MLIAREIAMASRVGVEVFSVLLDVAVLIH